MPKRWYTSPRGAKEFREEQLSEGFTVEPIKKTKIKGEVVWLVEWR